MGEKRAALLGFLILFGLGLVFVLFSILGVSVWQTHGGYVAEPSLLLRVISTLVCLIPIILAFVIVKMLAAIGKMK